MRFLWGPVFKLELEAHLRTVDMFQHTAPCSGGRACFCCAPRSPEPPGLCLPRSALRLPPSPSCFARVPSPGFRQHARAAQRHAASSRVGDSGAHSSGCPLGHAQPLDSTLCLVAFAQGSAPCWTHRGPQINTGPTETALTGRSWPSAEARGGRTWARSLGDAQRGSRFELGIFGTLGFAGLNPGGLEGRRGQPACGLYRVASSFLHVLFHFLFHVQLDEGFLRKLQAQVVFFYFYRGRKTDSLGIE